ncbi:hypothetical protein [Pedobacter frigoris]|uniref:hypothetical protein n=1 Tax=Pedobacter frigoris TaxID=2571272 RepID=UPI0029316F0A|nr:hypothetical protein [Pedobacter frigoris]
MKKLAILVISVLLLVGCGKDKPNEPNPVEPVSIITLTSPAQNSACITGTAISASQSAVELKWDKVNNATLYTITIKDLLTGTSTDYTATQNQFTASLNRNTPYAWSVATQASVAAVISKSEIWKFYNAGNGITWYAPFPADNLMPSWDQSVTTISGKTTLTWTGGDADNDILNYDVYLGTTSSPPLLKKEIAEAKLENVELTSKVNYYWKVVTRDKSGNTSESGVVPFTVK